MRPGELSERGYLARRQSERDGASAQPARAEHDPARTPGKRTLVELVYGSATETVDERSRIREDPRATEAAIQRKLAPGAAPQSTAQVQAAAGLGVSGTAAALPFRDRIQAAFGRHDISRVQAFTDAAAGAGAAAMGARAFATGTRIAFAGTPDLHTAAHEAAHVVQQRGGVQLKGGVGEANDVHERHADAVADRVVRGESAEALLDAYAPGSGAGVGAVQRMLVAADDGVHFREDRSGELFTRVDDGVFRNAQGDLLYYDSTTHQYRTLLNAMYDPVTRLLFEPTDDGRYREMRSRAFYRYDGASYLPAPLAPAVPEAPEGNDGTNGTDGNDSTTKRKREDEPSPDGAPQPKPTGGSLPDDADSESESDGEPPPRFLKRRRLTEVHDERDDPGTSGGLIHGLAERGVLADNHVHLHAAASLAEMESFTNAKELLASIKRIEAFLKAKVVKPKKPKQTKKAKVDASDSESENEADDDIVADDKDAAVPAAPRERHALSGEHLATKDHVSTGPTMLAEAVQPKLAELKKAQAALGRAEGAKDNAESVAEALAVATRLLDELGALLQMHKPEDSVYQGVETQTEFFMRFLRGQGDMFSKPKGRDDVVHSLGGKRRDTRHGMQEMRRSFAQPATIRAQLKKDATQNKARKAKLKQLERSKKVHPGLQARGQAFVMYGIGKSSMHSGPTKAKDIGWATSAVREFYARTKDGAREHKDLKAWVGIDSQGQEKGAKVVAESSPGNRLGNMWIPQGLNVLYRAREVRAQLLTLKREDSYPATLTSALGRVLGERGEPNDDDATLKLLAGYEATKLDAAIAELDKRIKDSETKTPAPFDYANGLVGGSVRLLDVASCTRAVVAALRAHRAETQDETKLPASLGFAPHGGEQLLAVHPVNLLLQMKSDILMGADRIGHGLVLKIERKHLEDILARGGKKLAVTPKELDDFVKLQGEVLALVRKHGVVIEANVSSNMEISNFTLEQHPARAMLESDVRVTINTDDPTWLGTTLASELSLLASMGVSREELARVILESYYQRMGTRSLWHRGALKDTYKEVLTDGITPSGARKLARHLAKAFGTPVYLRKKLTDADATLDVVLDAVFGVGLGSLDRALGELDEDGKPAKPPARTLPSSKAPDGKLPGGPRGPRVPQLRNHEPIEVPAPPRLVPRNAAFRAWHTLGGGNCAFNGFAQVIIGLVREGKRTAAHVAARLGGEVTAEQIATLAAKTQNAAISRTAANLIQNTLAGSLRACAAVQLAARPDLHTLIVSDFAAEVRQRVLQAFALPVPRRETDLFEDEGTPHAVKLAAFVEEITAEVAAAVAAAEDPTAKVHAIDLAWTAGRRAQAMAWMAGAGMVAYLANMTTPGVHAGIPELVALGDHFGVLVLAFSGQHEQPLEAEYSGGHAPIKLDRDGEARGRGEVAFLVAEVELLRDRGLIIGLQIDPADPVLSFRVHSLDEIGSAGLGPDLTERFVKIYTQYYRYRDLESDPIVVGLRHLGVHWEAVTTGGGSFDLNDATDRITALTAAQAPPGEAPGGAERDAPGVVPDAKGGAPSSAFTRPAIPGVNVVYTDIMFGKGPNDFDLTKFGITPADGKVALVNAANGKLHGGGGIDKAVHQIGGQAELDKEVLRWKTANPGRLTSNELPSGNAMATTGGRRKDLTRIIHAVGPDLRTGEPITRLDGCVEQILALAKADSIDTLIMCHLSGEIFVQGTAFTPADTANQILAALPAAIKKVGYTPTKLVMNMFPAPPGLGTRVLAPIHETKEQTS